MELRCKFRELDGGDTSPGWWWDADIRTWVEVKRNLGEWLGWRWDRALIEVYHTSSDLDGGETWPGLRWRMNIRTWMELRHCLEGGVMWLYGPGLGWDSTCMEVRLKSLDPDPDEIGPGWRSGGTWKEVMQVYWNLDSDGTGPVWSWDISWNLGEFDMVAAWIWDAILRTWMEVRRTSLILDELEMVPGWSWDAICGPGWRWDVTKMEVKWKYKDVDWDKVLPGWGGEVNLLACLEVRGPGRGWDGTSTELRQISWDLNKLWWD